ncbi:ketosteroid isomerase family protein [Pantanalinema sp. GBBB05]|uniref:ketosteroid isomerase family protein n=1 Tax=Pantanalinema sp. GBBB05 TaxID=2604139 RepID=UPI001D316BA6|nr:nuclear transport factor 2 family protein [Pantanalinema sp. GBBB05]
MQHPSPQSSTIASATGVNPVIEGINEPVIQRYFELLNGGEFQAASELFAEDGALQPPFEGQIVGRDAIANYLVKEAQGLILRPQWGKQQALDNGCTEFEIAGNVQTALFTVNVSWTMILSPWQELFLVRVKLLASLQELVKFRR